MYPCVEGLRGAGSSRQNVSAYLSLASSVATHAYPAAWASCLACLQLHWSYPEAQSCLSEEANVNVALSRTKQTEARVANAITFTVRRERTNEEQEPVIWQMPTHHSFKVPW